VELTQYYTPPGRGDVLRRPGAGSMIQLSTLSTTSTSTGSPQRSNSLPQLASVHTPNYLADVFTRFGSPGSWSDLDTEYHATYVSHISRQHRHPDWVISLLNHDTLTKSPDVTRANSKFICDSDMPAQLQVKPNAYTGSGYDRGHMCSAADAKCSQEAMDETFLMSNICPQVGEGFNRHYWAWFETWCRDLALDRHGKLEFSNVYVMTGTLYMPKRDNIQGKLIVEYEVIGSVGGPMVSVPTHFYKSVLAQDANSDQLYMATFILPNAAIEDSTKLESFRVDPKLVENVSGWRLFPNVRDKVTPLCGVVKCEVTGVPHDSDSNEPAAKITT